MGNLNDFFIENDLILYNSNILPLLFGKEQHVQDLKSRMKLQGLLERHR